MKIKNYLITLTAFAALLTQTNSVFAAGTSQCQIIYGGGQICQDKIQFSIDKKVMSNTKGGSFVDNLTSNDTRFQPATDVTFQITVTNTGDKTIPTLNVVDTLPSNTTFVSGAGSYNSSNNTISYTISNLEAGKSNTQTFVARIANSSNFSDAVTCLTNNVSANDNNGTSATDKAGFCVEKAATALPQPKIFKEAPPKTIPQTGPELLPLLSLIPAGITGYFLRRKSRLN